QLVERGLGTVTTTGNRHGRTLYAAARQPATTDRRRPGRLTAQRPYALLVQTLSPPNWAPLQHKGTITTARTQLVEQTWTTGTTAEIRTIASPQITRIAQTGKHRSHLTTPEDSARWLHQRLTKVGCTLEPHDITLRDAEWTCYSRADNDAPEREYQPVQLREFRATVTITDPHAFTTMLATGLGHNRAWGAGLVLARHTNREPGARNPAGKEGCSPDTRG
ncbi:type I-E CRISPR-associated protein Cas6/Cse3/CasE, partial [Streptomyces sp. NPDC089922]